MLPRFEELKKRGNLCPFDKAERTEQAVCVGKILYVNPFVKVSPTQRRSTVTLRVTQALQAGTMEQLEPKGYNILLADQIGELFSNVGCVQNDHVAFCRLVPFSNAGKPYNKLHFSLGLFGKATLDDVIYFKQEIGVWLSLSNEVYSSTTPTPGCNRRSDCGSESISKTQPDFKLKSKSDIRSYFREISNDSRSFVRSADRETRSKKQCQKVVLQDTSCNIEFRQDDRRLLDGATFFDEQSGIHGGKYGKEMPSEGLKQMGMVRTDGRKEVLQLQNVACNGGCKKIVQVDEKRRDPEAKDQSHKMMGEDISKAEKTVLQDDVNRIQTTEMKCPKCQYCGDFEEFRPKHPINVFDIESSLNLSTYGNSCAKNVTSQEPANAKDARGFMEMKNPTVVTAESRISISERSATDSDELLDSSTSLDSGAVSTNPFEKAKSKKTLRVRFVKGQLPYPYKKIKELRNNMVCHLYGVIKEIRKKPTLSASGRYHSVLYIIDETEEEGFRVHVYYKKEDVPPKLNESYIIRFHRLKIERDGGFFDGRVFNSFDVVTFDPKDPESLYTGARDISYCEEDVFRLVQLREWLVNNANVYSSCKVSEYGGPLIKLQNLEYASKQFSLRCTVVSVKKCIDTNAMILRVRDGTVTTVFCFEASIKGAEWPRSSCEVFHSRSTEVDIIVNEPGTSFTSLKQGDLILLKNVRSAMASSPPEIGYRNQIKLFLTGWRQNLTVEKTATETELKSNSVTLRTKCLSRTQTWRPSVVQRRSHYLPHNDSGVEEATDTDDKTLMEHDGSLSEFKVPMTIIRAGEYDSFTNL